MRIGKKAGLFAGMVMTGAALLWGTACHSEEGREGAGGGAAAVEVSVGTRVRPTAAPDYQVIRPFHPDRTTTGTH